MKLLHAAIMSYAGFGVMSCIGKVYSPKMLGVKWVGTHYASMNNCEMTDEERKGEWRSYPCEEETNVQQLQKSI